MRSAVDIGHGVNIGACRDKIGNLEINVARREVNYRYAFWQIDKKGEIRVATSDGDSRSARCRDENRNAQFLAQLPAQVDRYTV